MSFHFNWHCNKKSARMELRLKHRTGSFPLFMFWISRGDFHMAIFPLVLHIGTMKFVRPAPLTKEEQREARL